jgi:RiboL-PSP-HEPN
MNIALAVFRANLARVRDMHALHLHFSGLVTSAIDLSDLLRAEMVLIVSALDHFVHELTRLGMLEVWRGMRVATPAYLRFSVSLDVATQLISQAGIDINLETEIRTRHGYSSFQQPDDIALALRLFSTVELWKEMGALLGEDPKDLKARLKLIVARRNKIAHEADIDPSYPGQRWPISRQDSEEALNFVEKLGETIFQLVA